MKVKVLIARQTEKEYYFKILIHSDKPEEEQSIEEFTYSKEMTLQQIAKEFKALCRNKYEEPVYDTLPIEGDEYTI